MKNYLKLRRRIGFMVGLIMIGTPLLAQDCLSTVVLELKNIKGGFFRGQKVTLTSKVDGKNYSGNSNDRGEATLNVPCNEMYDLTIANYTKKVEVESPKGGTVKSTFSYQADMVEQQKRAAMNSTEQAAVDEKFKSLPDTTLMKSPIMEPPKTLPDYYAMAIINIRDLSNKPLENETVNITGRKRIKTIKGVTDQNGRLIVYLPKGDTYDLHFRYHKNFHSTESAYSKGSSSIKMGFSYIGTRETEKRMREEKERLLAEEKRLKEEKDAFAKKCRELGLPLEECFRKEREEYLRGLMSGHTDTVIMKVLRRNPWPEKLIVCDVTGSMSPYAAQLAMWYRLNFAKEKNLQLVLFNDGDNKNDDQKIIGATGGIYYSASEGIDSLDHFMSHVQSMGWGGDAPENNMEALIKGVKMADPFTTLIMIADNHAPVKDIRLLQSFSQPVHIIICRFGKNNVHPHYLKIAWKTKGSVHTMEEDIISLARLSEGQQVNVGGVTYRIMGGEFIRID